MKLFQLLLFFVSIDLIVSQCEDVSDVKFLLIRGREISKLYPKAISWRKIGSLLNSKYFDKNKRTVVYAHGFTESIETISTQTVISAYLKRKSEYNILIIDWTKHNDGNYILRGIPNALKVGAHIGRKLLKMSEIGFDLDKFEIVGHSLGTHVVGAIGRTTKLAENGFQLKRITGLDPAGPTFFPLNPFITPLNAFDAAFVDIIHTDAGMFGANVGTGHADFWPNGGKDQPGCPPYDSSNMLKIENFCNHFRSWQYFAESILMNETSDGFISTQCDSWEDFTNRQCFQQQPITAKMGFHVSPLARGNFFLRTNAIPPYSMDAD